MKNKAKIILDLCGGTGSWSKPYREAGYDVRLITLPDDDVRTYIPPEKVYGILAAPPCTMFSHARTVAKAPRDLRSGIKIVACCLAIIWETQYGIKTGEKKSPLKFWAIENPNHGMLKYFLGTPAFIFNPFDFGDNYKKQTALWGYFNDLVKKETGKTEFNRDHNHNKLSKLDRLPTKEIHPEYYGKLTRQERRAITPAGFAKAFFKANK